MTTHPPTLETERLILRSFETADAERVRELAGAREVYETTMLIPHPYETGMAEKWISTHAQAFYHGNGITCAIVEMGENAVIGAIAMSLNATHRRAELGYWIGVPYWGKGYCTEAAQAMLDYGFRELDLHRIYAHHMKANPASGRVMEKIGMKLEGELVDHVLKGGVFHAYITYGIIRPDYIGQKDN